MLGQSIAEETKQEKKATRFSSLKFEQFNDVNIGETTLKDLVQQLRERRDFSPTALRKMFAKANESESLGLLTSEPKARILLFPWYKDHDKNVVPFFDSDGLCPNNWLIQTIEDARSETDPKFAREDD